MSKFTRFLVPPNPAHNDLLLHKNYIKPNVFTLISNYQVFKMKFQLNLTLFSLYERVGKSTAIYPSYCIKKY